MPTVTNIHPGGDLELPLIGRTIAAGESFEATLEQAALLAEQPDVWKVAGSIDPTIDELRDQLRAQGLSTSGNKATLQARLAEANSTPEQTAPPAPADGTETGASSEGEATE